MAGDDAMARTKGLPAALDGEYSEWTSLIECSNQEWRDKDGVFLDANDRPTVAEIIEVWWKSTDGELGDEVGTELQLYAVVRFDDGRWGYVEAWNDYTGWGCQDGVEWNVTATPQELELRMTDEGRDHIEWRP